MKRYYGGIIFVAIGFLVVTLVVASGYAEEPDRLKSSETPLPEFLLRTREGTQTPALLPKPGLESLKPIEQPKYVPGELLVKFKPEVVTYIPADGKNKERMIFESESINDLNEKFGLISIEKAGPKGVDIPIFKDSYKLVFSKKTDILLIAKQYSQDPGVEYAEPNYIVSVSASAEEKSRE